MLLSIIASQESKSQSIVQTPCKHLRALVFQTLTTIQKDQYHILFPLYPIPFHLALSEILHIEERMEEKTG